ncbi:hypothetical protein HW555_000109 [Spodoptera exigua]|uniref:GAG-pre-integrase domain-containing protein n=1 Tax=Spodoptera exigua TaxID=7107 RepID=A0A835L953_SPOEX|nr:hypothetical protein HW555_000109 [Spodoptera exigua]
MAGKSVIVGNGTQISVKGSGQVAVQVWNGNEWIDTTIDNVLHIPELSTNLFSVNRATSKGYVIVTGENECKFYKENKVMAVAKRNGSMYYLDFRYHNTSEANVAEIKRSTLHEWHEKMAHQNMSYVKDVLKNNKVDINTQSSDSATCESCVKGKIHRLPYPRNEAEDRAQVVEEDDNTLSISESDSEGSLYEPSDSSEGGRAVYFLLLLTEKKKSSQAACTPRLPFTNRSEKLYDHRGKFQKGHNTRNWLAFFKVRENIITYRKCIEILKDLHLPSLRLNYGLIYTAYSCKISCFICVFNIEGPHIKPLFIKIFNMIDDQVSNHFKTMAANVLPFVNKTRSCVREMSVKINDMGVSIATSIVHLVYFTHRWGNEGKRHLTVYYG